MITTSAVGQTIIIRIEGRLDTLTSPQFDQEVKPLVEKQSFLAIDFALCPYLSSSGIRSLLTIVKKLNAQKGQLVLFNLSPTLIQVLEMAGLQKVFIITGTEDQALDEIKRRSSANSKSSELQFGNRKYRVHCSEETPNIGRHWKNQGYVGYNELGFSIGCGLYDELIGQTGVFVTTANSSAFIPDLADEPSDFRLFKKPDQSGILVQEALSFGTQPSCILSPLNPDPICFKQFVNDVKILGNQLCTGSPQILWAVANPEPASITIGLLEPFGPDHEASTRFNLSALKLKNSEGREINMILSYKLNQLDVPVCSDTPSRFPESALTFENIIDINRVDEQEEIANWCAWLFIPRKIEDAALSRLQIEAPDRIFDSPQKAFLARRLYTDSSRIEIKPLHGGFSAQTFQVESYDSVGRKLRPTVLKIADKEMITRESERCRTNALPFILNNSAMVLGTVFQGSLGALRYNFVGIGGEGSQLKWLTHLFESWPKEKLEPLFDKIFLQILKPWYGQAIPAEIHPFVDHNPLLTFFPTIFEKAGELLNISADEPQFLLEETGESFLNPYWFLKHQYPLLAKWPLAYYTSICHGDLNMQNILLDEEMNVYLIDFSETKARSAVSDFARLEAIFMVEATPASSEKEFIEAVGLVKDFYSCPSLGHQPSVACQGPNRAIIGRNVALSQKMRQYALATVKGHNDILPYWLALLEWVLPIVCFYAPLNQKKLSTVVASIVLEKVSENLKNQGVLK